MGLGFDSLETEAAGEKARPFESAVQDGAVMDYNKNHDPQNGRFTSGGGGRSKRTKASTKRSKNAKVKLNKKEFARVSSGIMTDHPLLEPGNERHTYCYGAYCYRFSVNGPGDYVFYERIPLK